MTGKLHPPNQARIQRACLDLVYDQTRTSWVSNALCVVLICFAFWGNADHRWMLGWIVAGTILAVLREIQARRYAAQTNEDFDARRWTRLLEFTLFANGCFWGIGCAALTMIATPYQVTIIVLIAGGLQTASIMVTSYLFRAFALFSVPLFLFTFVAILTLGLRDQPSLLVTAGLLVVWSLFFLVCGHRFGTHYRQSVGYALENLDLAESLGAKKSEIETLNLSLQRRISQLKTTQQELLTEQQRSEEAAQAKANFLATMSHEIRTPMNGVLGMAQLLGNSRLDTEQKGFVETILSSGKALLTIINDVLDLSKVEAGNLNLDPQRANLRTLLEDIGQLLSNTAASDGVALDLAYAPDLPEEFLVDDTRLRQVLINLIGNALKFTDQGSVFVDVTGRLQEGAVELHIDVSDTGIGIPKDKLDHIFEQFSQAESSTTRRFGGTGLGLSISNGLVDAMGGRIEVTSVYGEGSRFRVCLTLELADSRSHVEPASNGSIVIFTQDQWLLKSVSSYAQKRGVTPFPAAQIEQLEDILQSARQAPLALCIDQQAIRSASFNLRTLTDSGIPLVLIGVDQSLFEPQLTEIAEPRTLHRPFRLRDFVAAIEPIKNVHAPATPIESVSAERCFQDCRVLLVDDNAVNRMVAGKMLTKLGVAVEEASNGLLAVEACAQHSFDLVLMDVSMPVMDGPEAAAKIRKADAQAGNARTPIVALTAHAIDGDRDSFLSQGFDDYLAKPIDQSALKLTVATWVTTSVAAGAASQTVTVSTI